MKPDNFFEALNCAVEGVIHALKTQRHLKIHFVFAALAIIAALTLNMSVNDFAVIGVLITLVVVAELFNTALEYIMDILKEDFQIRVKYVKDISAGAVLFCSMTAFFIGIMIFSRYLFHHSAERLGEGTIYLAVVSLALVVITVIFIKAVLRSGRPLKGGMPSGHAAISFSVWVSIYMSVKNIYILGGAFLAAFLVSFSRMYLGIHKGNEVLLGAVIGGLITYLVFMIYGS